MSIYYAIIPKTIYKLVISIDRDNSAWKIKRLNILKEDEYIRIGWEFILGIFNVCIYSQDKHFKQVDCSPKYGFGHGI